MSILDRIIEYSNISKPSERVPKEDGGMLVKPSADGSRLGYKKDNPGSISFDGYGYNVKVGGSNNPNSVSQYFSKKNYGSLEKAKKAAEQFRKETVANFEFQPQGPQTGKQAAAEKAIQELLDEGKEVTTAAVKERLPKNLQKDFSGGKSYFDKAKKNFPNLNFKKSPRVFLKAPKDIAEVKKLIEDGLPLKEIQAKGYDVGFIKRVANNSNLEIAETSYDYYENVQKITKDLTKIGKNKKIVEAFENGTMSKDLKILKNITSYSKLPECKVGKAEGGRIGFALSDECIRDGLIEQKKLAASGNKKAAQELVDVAKVASRGGLLKNVLGPGAILGEAVFEGAIIGNKVLGGKPLNQAWAESYLSYLDPRKYKGELDPMLMERDRMLQSTADKNILRSGFSAQDQLSAFNKAIEERDLAKSRGRIDQYLPAAAEAREQGRLAGQSADVISSEAFKDATKVAQEYLQGQSGKQQADFGVLSVPQGDDPINLRRLKAMREMKNLYTQYSDQDLIKMLQDAGYNPQDIIDLKTTERLTPSFARTLGGLDVLRSQFQEQEAMQRIADAGGVANLAGGGIAKLAGVSKGPPPESGPNPQGLNYLIKRVTNS
jgi:hypothetical protein